MRFIEIKINSDHTQIMNKKFQHMKLKDLDDLHDELKLKFFGGSK